MVMIHVSAPSSDAKLEDTDKVVERSNISTIWVPLPSDRAPDSSPEPAHVGIQ